MNGIRTGTAPLKLSISCGMGVCSSKVTSLNQNRLCLLLGGANVKSKHFRSLHRCSSFTCDTILNGTAFCENIVGM